MTDKLYVEVLDLRAKVKILEQRIEFNPDWQQNSEQAMALWQGIREEYGETIKSQHDQILRLQKISSKHTELLTIAGELHTALAGVELLFEQPDENSMDHFDRVGDVFKIETGYLRPGKDCRLHEPEIRKEKFSQWMDEKVANARTALNKYRTFIGG